MKKEHFPSKVQMLLAVVDCFEQTKVYPKSLEETRLKVSSLFEPVQNWSSCRRLKFLVCLELTFLLCVQIVPLEILPV